MSTTINTNGTKLVMIAKVKFSWLQWTPKSSQINKL